MSNVQPPNSNPPEPDPSRKKGKKCRIPCHRFFDFTLTDLLIAAFTAILTIVAIFQYKSLEDANGIAAKSADAAKTTADVAVKSIDFAKTSADAAEKSATAAKESADIMRKQLRADIAVTGIAQGIDADGPITVHLIVKNVGATRADDLMVSFTPEIRKCQSDPVYNSAQILTDVREHLVAGDAFYLDREIKSPDRLKLRANSAAIYAEGSVTYKDVFGADHVDVFHLIQGGPYPLNNPLMGILPSTSPSKLPSPPSAPAPERTPSAAIK